MASVGSALGELGILLALQKAGITLRPARINEVNINRGLDSLIREITLCDNRAFSLKVNHCSSTLWDV